MAAPIAGAPGCGCRRTWTKSRRRQCPQRGARVPSPTTPSDKGSPDCFWGPAQSSSMPYSSTVSLCKRQGLIGNTTNFREHDSLITRVGKDSEQSSLLRRGKGAQRGMDGCIRQSALGAAAPKFSSTDRRWPHRCCEGPRWLPWYPGPARTCS